MKKLVATAAVAAVLGSAAFADVSVGAWGRAVWIGAANQVHTNEDGTTDGNDIVMANTQGWRGAGPRNGISFHGNHDDNIGFDFDIHCNNTTIKNGDVAQVWWSPIHEFKLYLGKVDNNWLRGDACYGLWDMYRIGALKAGNNGGKEEEGWTFMGQGATGAVLQGLFLDDHLKAFASLGFDSTDGSTWDNGTGTEGTKIDYVLGRQSNYALAYDIDGVGTIKAGLQEGWDRVTVKDGDSTKEKDQNIINVAFDLTAVENLYVGIGAFIPMVQKVYNEDVSDDVGVGNRVNAYARFGATDQLTIHARVGTVIGSAYEKKDSYEKDGGFGFLVGAGVDYALMESLTLFGQVDYADGIYWNASKKDDTDVLDFGIGVKKDYGDGCSIAVAFEGATNNNGVFKLEKADDFAWCVPIVITYSF